jgi:hypothetical protein
MIELYWQALTRDVPFAEYDSHALTNVAAVDLSKCSDFLTRIVMVGVVFVGMGEVLSQLLFSYEKFFLPGLAASGANLVVGLGILSLGHTYGAVVKKSSQVAESQPLNDKVST